MPERISKTAADKLVREKSKSLKEAYKKNNMFLTVHKTVHLMAGVDVTAETVRRVLRFKTNPLKSIVAPKVFETFNTLLTQNNIEPIPYQSINHHFPLR